eukprot:16061468-Heterocapsa_arctica.AAC.1
MHHGRQPVAIPRDSIVTLPWPREHTVLVGRVQFDVCQSQMGRVTRRFRSHQPGGFDGRVGSPYFRRKEVPNPRS